VETTTHVGVLSIGLANRGALSPWVGAWSVSISPRIATVFRSGIKSFRSRFIWGFVLGTGKEDWPNAVSSSPVHRCAGRQSLEGHVTYSWTRPTALGTVFGLVS
jgi:hypothetical protein